MIVNSPRPLVFLASLSALTALAAPLQAADRLTAGEYQATVTIDGKAQTFTHCVTAAEAKWMSADARTGREAVEKYLKGACTIQAYDVTGDTVSYTMACGPNIVKSKTTYHGDSFEGGSTSTYGTPEVSTSRGTSKRIATSCARQRQPSVWTWLPR